MKLDYGIMLRKMSNKIIKLLLIMLEKENSGF